MTREAYDRRTVLGRFGLGGVAMMVSGHARAADMPSVERGWAPLIGRANAALDSLQGRIAEGDRMAVVDFSLPSSTPRLLLVDRLAGRTQLLRVAHGRGSDPDHSGWLQRFSNQPASNASSRGAYVTGPVYVGAHGRSRRLIGLEDSNDNAESRAIVIHGAWYCNDDVLTRTGKLGRSEGCFAVSENAIAPLLDWLGPGRLLYADKV